MSMYVTPKVASTSPYENMFVYVRFNDKVFIYDQDLVNTWGSHVHIYISLQVHRIHV